MKHIKTLVEDIHSTIVATIGADGHPQTRVIDMMHYDEEGIYFLTAKGKMFYFVGEGCSGCKVCYSVCPQKCIDVSVQTAVIDKHHCLHCGRCAEVCPKQVIEKRG